MSNIVKWLVIIAAVIVGGLFVLNYIFSRPPDGRDGSEQPDGKLDPLPQVNHKLDIFRAPWNSNGSRFEHWQAVKALARFSQIAYNSQEDVRKELLEAGFEKVDYFDSEFHSMAAYVATGQEIAVVIFRGTDGFQDWTMNINVATQLTAKGPVHLGFSTCYATLRPYVLNALGDLKDKEVWITGHSLGGALALIHAYDLEVNHGVTLKGVMTFGQPMVSQQPLSDFIETKLKDRYAYFVNESDPVPRLVDGFHHSGSQVWFKKDGIARFPPPIAVVAANVEGQDNAMDQKVERLKPMNKVEFKVFQMDVLQKAEEFNLNNANLNLGNGRVVGRNLFVLPNDWVRFHEMKQYIDKIDAAIRRAFEQ